MTHGWARLGFALAAKTGAAAALGLVRVYTEELFPANVRAAALQACALVSSILSSPPACILCFCCACADWVASGVAAWHENSLLILTPLPPPLYAVLRWSSSSHALYFWARQMQQDGCVRKIR